VIAKKQQGMFERIHIELSRFDSCSPSHSHWGLRHYLSSRTCDSKINIFRIAVLKTMGFFLFFFIITITSRRSRSIYLLLLAIITLASSVLISMSITQLVAKSCCSMVEFF
jgi:hypothetical protein